MTNSGPVKVCVLALTLLFSCVAASAQLVVNDAPLHQTYADSRAAVIEAYKRIGLDLELANLPYTRSAVSANLGEIDGLLLRLKNHTDEYKNLIRIDVDLAESKTLLVINRALCNRCSLKSLKSIASVSGFDFPKDIIALTDKANYLIELSDHEKLWRFFKASRVNAIVTSELFLPEAFRDNEKYRYIEIGSQGVYHYLHRNHVRVAKHLELAFKEMAEEGSIVRPRAFDLDKENQAITAGKALKIERLHAIPKERQTDPTPKRYSAYLPSPAFD